MSEQPSALPTDRLTVMTITADDFTVGQAKKDNLADLLTLYQYLNPGDPVLSADDSDIAALWSTILANDGLHYVVARDMERGAVISTCALTLIPNLTRGARPYGLIENVVTHPDWRRRGVGTAVLQYALEIAWTAGCYKVMLLTGSKNENTLRFYERAGFSRGVKTGFAAYRP